MSVQFGWNGRRQVLSIANKTCDFKAHVDVARGFKMQDWSAAIGKLLPRTRGGWSLHPTLGGYNWPTSAGGLFLIF